MLKNHLRAERDTRALKKLLTEDEIDALGSVVHKPQFVLGRLRALMHASRKAGVGDKERELLLKCTSSLGECLGASPGSPDLNIWNQPGSQNLTGKPGTKEAVTHARLIRVGG